MLRVKQRKKSGLGLLHSEDGSIRLGRHVSALHVVLYIIFSVCVYKIHVPDDGLVRPKQVEHTTLNEWQN